MEQLKLNHLSAYLPYGLKVQTKLRETTESGKPMNRTIGELHGLYNNYGSDCSVLFIGETPKHEILDIDLKDIKPLLRPLSEFEYEDIVKIKEHLGLGQWCDHYDQYFDAWFNDACSVQKLVLQCPYEIMQFFLWHHFDVFGLIDKGLAIDINTLTTHPKQ